MKIPETLSEVVGTIFVNFSSHVCVLWCKEDMHLDLGYSQKSLNFQEE